LIGRDGNAFALIAAACEAVRKAGWSKDQINALLKDMMSDDYDHLLGVVMHEFDVH
jgi:hypothetical protein